MEKQAQPVWGEKSPKRLKLTSPKLNSIKYTARINPTNCSSSSSSSSSNRCSLVKRGTGQDVCVWQATYRACRTSNSNSVVVQSRLMGSSKWIDFRSQTELADYLGIPKQKVSVAKRDGTRVRSDVPVERSVWEIKEEGNCNILSSSIASSSTDSSCKSKSKRQPVEQLTKNTKKTKRLKMLVPSSRSVPSFQTGKGDEEEQVRDHSSSNTNNNNSDCQWRTCGHEYIGKRAVRTELDQWGKRIGGIWGTITKWAPKGQVDASAVNGSVNGSVMA